MIFSKICCFSSQNPPSQKAEVHAESQILSIFGEPLKLPLFLTQAMLILYLNLKLGQGQWL